MLTTYSTIKEAFKNGKGDAFFGKDQSYICLSRHDKMYQEMKDKGFTFLYYDEVIKLAGEQEPRKPHQEDIKPVEKVQKLSDDDMKTKAWLSFISQDYNGIDGFYQEFPDAFGQYL